MARLYFGALGQAPSVADLAIGVTALKAGQLMLAQDADARVHGADFLAKYGRVDAHFT